MKIIVAGGGYAGLACMIELRRRLPDAEIHLYDPRSCHLKLTHLHETLRHERGRYEVSFARLAEQFGFVHHQAEVKPGERCLLAEGKPLRYDFAALATGARSPSLPRGEHCYSYDDLARQQGRQVVAEFVADRQRPRSATVVGAGATGVQFVFELAERLRELRCDAAVRLIDAGDRPVASQPVAVGDYILQRLKASGIEYYRNSRLGAAEGALLHLQSGQQHLSLDSGLTLLCAGSEPSPAPVFADSFGRVPGFDNVFAAGDCAIYETRADDFRTAQVAVRQGKHIAINIDRASRGIESLEYYFRELGYVVSLGALDAAGWMLTRSQVVTGVPAFAIKGAVEAQYDLLVAGIDTYIV